MLKSYRMEIKNQVAFLVWNANIKDVSKSYQLLCMFSKNITGICFGWWWWAWFFWPRSLGHPHQACRGLDFNPDMKSDDSMIEIDWKILKDWWCWCSYLRTYEDTLCTCLILIGSKRTWLVSTFFMSFQDYRQDLVVILAGYSSEMARLMLGYKMRGIPGPRINAIAYPPEN